MVLILDVAEAGLRLGISKLIEKFTFNSVEVRLGS